MFTTIAIVFIISSIVASSLTIAAAALSSRISQEESYVEVYEIEDESPQFAPSSYSWES
jgi:hypothetical protein